MEHYNFTGNSIIKDQLQSLKRASFSTIKRRKMKLKFTPLNLLDEPYFTFHLLNCFHRDIIEDTEGQGRASLRWWVSWYSPHQYHFFLIMGTNKSVKRNIFAPEKISSHLNQFGEQKDNPSGTKFTCSSAIEFRHICWTPKRLMDFISAKA